MKTKVLPAVWCCTAVVTFVGAYVAAEMLGLHPMLGIVAAWLASILASLIAGSAVLRLKPDLKFCTRQQLVGLGFVHEPISVVFYMTVFALAFAALQILKR